MALPGSCVYIAQSVQTDIKSFQLLSIISVLCSSILILVMSEMSLSLSMPKHLFFVFVTIVMTVSSVSAMCLMLLNRCRNVEFGVAVQCIMTYEMPCQILDRDLIPKLEFWCKSIIDNRFVFNYLVSCSVKFVIFKICTMLH